MRKALEALTVVAVISLVASCGGGGGSSATSETFSTTTTGKSGLTVVSGTARSVTPSYLFISGLRPELICDEGVYFADRISQTELHFKGDSFTNCTLTFTSPDGRIVYSGLNRFTAQGGSVLRLNEDFTLTTVSGEVTELTGLQDADRDKIADELEDETPVYDKTVIIVMEGDDLGDSALTEELKRNYNDLVAGLQATTNTNTKFIVIWDGGLREGLDGSSDVFILDPHSGKDFTVLDDSLENILSGDSVSNYYDDGIKFWFAPSDNISNNLKELIEIAVKMYPANSYDLIISDHGDGWVSLPTPTTRTVLFEYFNDGQQAGTTWLGTKQFVDTVLAPLASEGIRFDLIGFDECLMGEFTTLSLVASYANVLVASPEYEQGDGWGDVWKELPAWYGQGLSTWEIAKAIVDGYINYYKQNPPNVPLAYPTDIALTAVKTSALNTLRTAFEQFAESLKQTAENTKDNLYNLFITQISNNQISGMETDVYWNSVDFTSGYIPNVPESDELADTLYSATATEILFPPDGYGTYHHDYGGGLGGDLLSIVTLTGLAERVKELGYNSNFPEVNPYVAQNALSFLDTYNQVKESDELYTKYLTLDMQGGYSENVTGSGLSLIYPYTSPDYADSPKLNFWNYPAFVENYKDVFPNYAAFVRTVFGEMWRAIGNAWKLVKVNYNGREYFGYYQPNSFQQGLYENVEGFISVSNFGNKLTFVVWNDGRVTENTADSNGNYPLVGNYKDVVVELQNVAEEEVYGYLLREVE